MTAVTAAAAPTAADANTKLDQLFLGQHAKARLDSSDQAGFVAGDAVGAEDASCAGGFIWSATETVDCATQGVGNTTNQSTGATASAADTSDRVSNRVAHGPDSSADRADGTANDAADAASLAGSSYTDKGNNRDRCQ